MIVGFLGTMGNAKTLSTVFLANYWKEITDIKHVVANFNTEVANHYVASPKELDELTQQFKEDNKQAIYILDEVWAWMNSRKAAENDLMTEIVLNSRKRGGIIIWTSQRKGLVDVNLTENTDYLGATQHYEATFTGKDYDIAKIQLVKNSEPPKMGRKFTYNAEPYYGLYDTDEEVATVSEAEQHESSMLDIMEQVISGSFKTKKEIVDYLSMNKIFSNTSQAERFAGECIRRLREANYVERGNDHRLVVLEDNPDDLEELSSADADI